VQPKLTKITQSDTTKEKTMQIITESCQISHLSIPNTHIVYFRFCKFQISYLETRLAFNLCKESKHHRDFRPKEILNGKPTRVKTGRKALHLWDYY